MLAQFVAQRGRERRGREIAVLLVERKLDPFTAAEEVIRMNSQRHDPSVYGDPD